MLQGTGPEKQKAAKCKTLGLLVHTRFLNKTINKNIWNRSTSKFAQSGAAGSSENSSANKANNSFDIDFTGNNSSPWSTNISDSNF